MKIFTTKSIKKISILIFWLLIWGTMSLMINSQILLPSPILALKALCELIVKKYFWVTIFNSMIRVVLGITLSIILGVFLGVVSGLNSFIEELLQPFVISVKATPVMGIIIIALVWFKSNDVPIFTTILMCFPIIYINVLNGIKTIDVNLVKMAKLYKVKKIYILKDIYLPSIKNYIYSGILMCLGIGWKVSVASEVLSTPKYSIGLNLLNAKITLQTEEVFAWTIIVILLSIIFESIFKNCIRRKYGK